MANRYDYIFLDLVGEGKYFTDIKNDLSNFRYKDRIRCYDWIAPDKIPDCLSDIDIGLLPLIHNSKFNRAKSPTKLFEYMAMAKPTVSSNIGEATHIIKDGESGFLARTKEDFIEKMEILIKDKDLRQRIGQNARKSVEEEYSLNVLGKKLYEIFRDIKM